MKIFRLWVAVAFWALGMITLADAATTKSAGEAAFGGVVALVAVAGMKVQIDRILNRK